MTTTAAARRRANPRAQNALGLGRLDKGAALGLGIVGTAIGVASGFAAAGTHRVWSRALVAGLTGGATGAVLGALLPKGRAGNPLQNPLGTATAVAAGAALALVPVAITAKVLLPKAAHRSAAPTVHAKMGQHNVDVYRNGPTWAWRAPGIDMAGAGDTREDAIINAYSEIVIANLQPFDTITLDFYPEQFQVKVENTGDTWRWSSTNGEGGDAPSRGDALLKALDWVDAHSEID